MTKPNPPSAPSLLTSFFDRPLPLYLSAALLRLIFLIYGLWQDANSPVKYTDIDYLVFTDAARFVSQGQSPYARETYRYTPVLAWLLLPTSWCQTNQHHHHYLNLILFSSGKILFALADLIAGYLLELILTTTNSKSHHPLPPSTARKFASIWLLNPMVATISTRGSSEGLLGVLTTFLLWSVLSNRLTLSAILLGFSVHFKIYPFIYAPAIIWWMGPTTQLSKLITLPRLKFAFISLSTFLLLNYAMFYFYGIDFIQHTYLHHVTRVDHRHNFSPYNTQLYLSSAFPELSEYKIESLAFLPQLLLSCLLIPLATAKKDLAGSMLAQTFAFVTFNKVCTSQYFLWYMVLLPLYLPNSSFLKNKTLGLTALGLWVLGQAMWLQQGYELEFLGKSTFLPGLWVASLVFFGVNCWILGEIIGDIGTRKMKHL
ncbi:PIG-M-domain-containing protein [Podospora fimiseda]|uniref:GPI mannosyltransferase 1 n=1 Tax=Podospora fimiseda TaxID=252190 RepID=A0AAN7H2Q1_9PEZI|nr:PIG-M-domain-containing protein [Podospora fimiseda]